MSKINDGIIRLQTVDSTNSFAEKLLKQEEVPEGTIIWAHQQTAGKGQGENQWISPPGENLTFSMILYPRFLPPDQQFLLNMTVTLAILDFLNSLDKEEQFLIKWPNDIYHGTRKLAGILINNILTGSLFAASIIGIGININQTVFDSSLPDPTSLKLILGCETDLQTAINRLIVYLQLRYTELQNNLMAQLNHQYLLNLLGYNKIRKYRTERGLFMGKIRKVDSFGRLIITTLNNEELVFAHKEIEYIFD